MRIDGAMHKLIKLCDNQSILIHPEIVKCNVFIHSIDNGIRGWIIFVTDNPDTIFQASRHVGQNRSFTILVGL